MNITAVCMTVKAGANELNAGVFLASRTTLANTRHVVFACNVTFIMESKNNR